MALCDEIIKNLYGYSRAKYSTWFYYKPDNLLLDVGEGVSIAMQNKIYAIDKIFISHGHTDHIAGLPGFLSSRASSMGDRHKELSLYYPKGDKNITKLKRYIEDALGDLPFEVIWQEFTEGEQVNLASNRVIQAFSAKHNTHSIALGYKIIEYRSRLKLAYRDMSNLELMKIINQEGKEAVTEKYAHTLLCFSGDSMPLDLPNVQNSEVLLHDCTFLKVEDREEETHAALDEVLQLALQANISMLGLFHFSSRYRHQEIIKNIRQQMEAFKVSFPIFYLLSHSAPFLFRKISEDIPVNPLSGIQDI